MTKTTTPVKVSTDVAVEVVAETVNPTAVNTGTEVVPVETAVFDNTEVEEVVEAQAEGEESDLGNGTTMVSYN